MQRCAVSPGFAVGRLYAAEPASSSLRVTSPAVMLLASLLVVFENAENAPVPATAPAMPRIASERSVLRTVEMTASFALLRWRVVSTPHEGAFSRGISFRPANGRKQKRARSSPDPPRG